MKAYHVSAPPCPYAALGVVFPIFLVFAICSDVMADGFFNHAAVSRLAIKYFSALIAFGRDSS